MKSKCGVNMIKEMSVSMNRVVASVEVIKKVYGITGFLLGCIAGIVFSMFYTVILELWRI